MLLAYIDESGNTGDPSKGGSTLTYTLGCVLVSSDSWPAAFDEMAAFRRSLRDQFGIRVRAEVKANYLTRSGGEIRRLGLPPADRRDIYVRHLQLLQELPARAFAVVVDKRGQSLAPSGVFDMAWETLLQRLERTSSKERETVMIVHDEGEDVAVRKWIRRARRYLTAGSAYGGSHFQNPARLLVDDPVARQSSQSYFVQLADLVAYAAFRAVIPPGASLAQVCPSAMWDEIGSATHAAVSGLRPRSRPGIVLRS